MSDEEVRRASARPRPLVPRPFQTRCRHPGPTPSPSSFDRPPRVHPPSTRRRTRTTTRMISSRRTSTRMTTSRTTSRPLPPRPSRPLEASRRISSAPCARKTSAPRANPRRRPPPASRLLPFPPSPSIARIRPLTSVTHALETLSPSAWSNPSRRDRTRAETPRAPRLSPAPPPKPAAAPTPPARDDGKWWWPPSGE